MNLKNKRSEGIKYLTVFGAGNYAHLLCEYYGEKQIKENVDAFIVSSLENNPVELCGVPVLEMSALPHAYYQGSLIIALAKEKRDAVEALVKDRFSEVLYLEEFVEMSYLQTDIKRGRENELIEYYKYFEEKQPLFKYIEIETINRCNGNCGFCPVNKNEVQRPFCRMSSELFYNIIDQLAGLNYEGRVALFSNNEAFLDKRIITFAKYCRKKLPHAYIYITTNGTLLNNDNFEKIMPYLDGLNIDIYTKGENSENPHNIKAIVELAKLNHWEQKLRISRMNENAIRSSRGGESPNSKVAYTISDKCPLLFVQIVIRPDGKVSLCCNDALGKVTMGDLMIMPLKDIWYDEQYSNLRSRIMSGRDKIELCRYCDYIDRRELWDLRGSGFDSLKEVNYVAEKEE